MHFFLVWEDSVELRSPFTLSLKNFYVFARVPLWGLLTWLKCQFDIVRCIDTQHCLSKPSTLGLPILNK